LSLLSLVCPVPHPPTPPPVPTRRSSDLQPRARSLLGARAGPRDQQHGGRRPENLHRGVVARSRDDEIGGLDVAERVRDGNSNLQDRKSTRLNSSHGSISYAVFCLKKKTN